MLDHCDRRVLGNLDGVAATGDAEGLGVHVDGAQALCARGRRLVDVGVIDDTASHLGGVGALAVHLEPCPTGTEGVVRDETDRKRGRLGGHKAVLVPRLNENCTIWAVDWFSTEKETSSLIPSARRRAAADGATE